MRVSSLSMFNKKKKTTPFCYCDGCSNSRAVVSAYISQPIPLCTHAGQVSVIQGPVKQVLGPTKPGLPSRFPRHALIQKRCSADAIGRRTRLVLRYTGSVRERVRACNLINMNGSGGGGCRLEGSGFCKPYFVVMLVIKQSSVGTAGDCSSIRKHTVVFTSLL